MNNRDLENFVKYFTTTFQVGNSFLDKREERAIQRERNRIATIHNAATEKDRDLRTQGYLKSVENAGVLSRARAQKALAGGITAPGPSPGVEGFMARWGAPAGGTQSEAPQINVQAPENDPAPISPPADDAPTPEYAAGGVVGDMSLSDAERGGPGGGKNHGTLAAAGNMFANTFHMPSQRSGYRDDPGDPPRQNRIQRLIDGPPTQAFTPTSPPGSITSTPLAPLPGYARGGRVGLPFDEGTSGPVTGRGFIAAPPIDVRRGT